MKNILVPTDFSENCHKAANLAIDMAKLFAAEVHFLHLLRTPVNWKKLSKEKEKRYPETVTQISIAKSKLKDLDKLAEQQDLVSRTFLEFSDDQSDILKHAGHFHHDFIITGSSGTKGIIREITGSNVEQIVRKSKVPVIVVKEDDVVFPFKNIAFVSDFLEDVDSAFKHVLSIADKCKAHIHLLRINTQTDFNSIELGLEPIKEFVHKHSKLTEYSMNVYNESTVELGINKFLENQNVDLITMCTHGKSGFLSLFSKSIAEGVTNHSTLPVMTMHF